MVGQEPDDDALDSEEGPGEDDLNQIADAELVDDKILAVDDDDDDHIAAVVVPGDDVEVDIVEDEADVVLVEDDGDEDDVEAGLDVILKERLVAGDDVAGDDDDDDDDDDDERPDATVRLLPKQPNEFACKSCFLVKHIGQLADGEKMLCRDCV